MRTDDLYLVDMVEAAESLARALEGKDLVAFREDESLQAATNWHLLVMGEAANQMSVKTQKALGEGPVRRVRRFRNRLAHGYFNLEVDRVYAMATTLAPELLRLAEAELGQAYPQVHAELLRRRSGKEG